MNLRKTASGLITVVDPSSDVPLLEQEVLQCCHCGGIFPKKPAKLATKFFSQEEALAKEKAGAKMRGWCMNCAGPVCGPSCAACIPTEVYLENLEKGRPADFKPTQVFVPRDL